MSKRIINPKAVNLIAKSLTGTSDDYFIGNCEWNNGTRSDMVLEPKSAHSDLSPLILEIQYTVNLAFMKRAVNYCLQAFTRYDIEPIILIICVEKMDQDIYKHMKPSTLPGVFSYFSQPWAENCYVISKESIKNNLTIPLEPMVALGAFFTSSSPSLSNHPFKDDPTIQYLYTSSFFQQQMETVNKDTPFKLIDLQLMEYDRLKTLASSLEQPVFEEAINDAKLRTLTIKRKYEDSFTPPSPASSTATEVDKNNDTYKAAMEFVVGFKQKKVEQKKRMDWVACLKEGEDLKILNYKNSESLRRQFYKYMKGNAEQVYSNSN
ncbi:hypothetical protein CU098_004340 [Rhizopus stolonifer]|uniref:Uncharacterized protein n=1 Tax=Rhizopus stolonifer TaxID=4846 RepID=A0A367J8J2_RHIST|nr:hypothetical protein CU098_004340 [Rhizopus stolonifer]